MTTIEDTGRSGAPVYGTDDFYRTYERITCCMCGSTEIAWTNDSNTQSYCADCWPDSRAFQNREGF